jgi:hypothetical protein
MSLSFILFMLFVAMLLASVLIAAGAGIRTFLKRGKASSPRREPANRPLGSSAIRGLTSLGCGRSHLVQRVLRMGC